MKQFIKSTILLSLVFIILYITAVILVGLFIPSSFNLNFNYPQGSYGFMSNRMKDAKNIKNIDILFLGSSHAYRSFDPKVYSQYNLRTFNLGSSGQTPLQTKMLLDKYLIQFNPKLVIWDIYPVTFELNGVESAVDIIANDQIDLGTIKMVIKTNDIKAYNTLIYGIIRQILNLNHDYKALKSMEDEIYITNTGFVEKELNFITTNKDFQKRKYSIIPKQLEAFKQGILKLKKMKIKTILVQVPFTNKQYNSMLNNSEVDSLFSSYNNYINFNEYKAFQDEIDFYDYDHLNRNGINKFNKLLINVLHKDFF